MRMFRVLSLSATAAQYATYRPGPGVHDPRRRGSRRAHVDSRVAATSQVGPPRTCLSSPLLSSCTRYRCARVVALAARALSYSPSQCRAQAQSYCATRSARRSGPRPPSLPSSPRHLSPALLVSGLRLLRHNLTIPRLLRVARFSSLQPPHRISFIASGVSCACMYLRSAFFRVLLRGPPPPSMSIYGQITRSPASRSRSPPPVLQFPFFIFIYSSPPLAHQPAGMDARTRCGHAMRCTERPTDRTNEGSEPKNTSVRVRPASRSWCH